MDLNIHVYLHYPADTTVIDGLTSLSKGQTHIMAQNDDLKAAVARVGASVSAEIKAVSDKLATIGSDNPVVAEAITSLKAMADTLDAETATLTGTATPTPEPTPAPTDGGLV